jgi:hypothetical protein
LAHSRASEPLNCSSLLSSLCLPHGAPSHRQGAGHLEGFLMVLIAAKQSIQEITQSLLAPPRVAQRRSELPRAAWRRLRLDTPRGAAQNRPEPPRAAPSQSERHTVNIQSTSSQHPVNIQSTSSQHGPTWSQHYGFLYSILQQRVGKMLPAALSKEILNFFEAGGGTKSTFNLLFFLESYKETNNVDTMLTGC